MKRLPWMILLFAVFSAALMVGLIFFQIPFSFYSLMSWKDVIDLLTPLILIPLYWLIFIRASSEKENLLQQIAFIIFSALWVLGHGMHLTANSIGNLIETAAESGRLNILNSDVYALSYFYDEILGHYLWHFGLIGLAVLLTFREWNFPAKGSTWCWIIIPAGILYGTVLFIIFVEGQTVPLGLPASLVIGGLLGIKLFRKFWLYPLTTFFFISFLMAVVLMGGWGLFFHGFPELSDFALFNIR